MQSKDFKINASSCGKIMGAKGLGQTGKTLVEEKIVEDIFDRKKEFSNKFTNKGDIVENGSIEFVEKVLGYKGITKNEYRYQNDFMKGTPDVIMKGKIIDVKSSWDCFTFPFFREEMPTKDKGYYWQAQVYMDLVGIDSFELIYILMDTPIHLIEKESYYWCKDNGYEDRDGVMLREFKDRMQYDDIPDEHRIRKFEIKRNDDDIKKIISRVGECREYIEKLKY